ncbi:methyltransferase domain-containing protein [Nocardioides sp. C4-1]|uniref:class I SAM-dependent methyltransferase n=1 Tax=Nocardioides sp. C4-1 TaxID=3151851 RepID=UPI00326526FC
MSIDLDRYPRRYCSICHSVVRKEFAPGPGGRPNASCPRCGSLERHRFFSVLLSVLEPLLGELDVLLEVAPSPETSPQLSRLGARRHVRLDLGADNRLVDVLGSLTDLPLPDDSVDLMVCYHVLEHIPDDLAAMQEIARVLAPTGVAVLQVPYRAGTLTDEDPDADEAERVRRFGRADHVRYYGDDFEDRLVASGLSIERVSPRSLLGEDMSTWLHVNPDELVWIARSRAGASVPGRGLAAPTALTRTMSDLIGELTLVHTRLRETRGEVRRLRTSQPPAPRTTDADTADSAAMPAPVRHAGRAARRVGGRVVRGAKRRLDRR